MSRAYGPSNPLLTPIPTDRTPNDAAETHPRERKHHVAVVAVHLADPQIKDRSFQTSNRARLSGPPGMGNMPNFPTQPPSLPANRIVPLPSLAAGMPILVHPLLQYHSNILSIVYDLSLHPSTAECPASRTRLEYRSWRGQPAMHPSTVTSLTVRMPGIESPVVVFPSRRDSMVVTIDDVLGAVSSAVRRAVLDQLTSQATGDSFGLGRRGYIQSPQPFYTDAQLTSDVRRRLSRARWWGGLYASPTERDVWILHTSEYRPH
ncbi:unnamed protein product [Cyclocybe aegerita]|uniref:DUF6699 domain-containing protein n=1 Tax=Cyclocybe aegerita TaxID=1973307 RepID=A0A8S0WG69_CYCAE|nr:unnamed protein product [Cyclocybe aegerita]